jgi:hypothetical protein
MASYSEPPRRVLQQYKTGGWHATAAGGRGRSSEGMNHGWMDGWMDAWIIIAM